MNYIKNILKHFGEISKIPRGSGKEEKIAKYLKNFFEINGAKKVVVDKANNVSAYFDASKNYENKESILLQGHSDMIQLCKEDNKINFDKDPITFYVENNWIKSNGTTLGADNGAGLSIIMEIVSNKDIKHGPLEVLVTANEEPGLLGAVELPENTFKSKFGLNLDAVSENKLIIASFGGNVIKANTKFIGAKTTKDDVIFTIEIRGLKGGHSGEAIKYKLMNALLVLNNGLATVLNETSVKLVNFEGGFVTNSIPDKAVVKFAVAKDKSKLVEKIMKDFINEMFTSHKDLEINAKFIINFESEIGVDCISENDTKRIINCINVIPNGVLCWSLDFNLPSIASNISLMRVNHKDKTLSFTIYSRSADNIDLKHLAHRIKLHLYVNDFTVEKIANFPCWQSTKNSDLEKIVKRAYINAVNYEPKSEIIIGGLEPGIIIDKNKQLNMICFGPEIKGEHSITETCSLESADRIVKIILEIFNIIYKK